MTKLILALMLLSLPAAFAGDGIDTDKAKKEGKKTVTTVKKDSKKLGKSAKSEAKKAWGKAKNLFQ